MSAVVIKKTGNGVRRLFEAFDQQVVAAYSERCYSTERRSDFLRAVELNPDNLFWVRQVHGENIVRVNAETKSTTDMMADGLITNLPGSVLGILTADCLPVFFWDPVKRAVGIAHAGWRGALHGIAPKMVAAFQQNFGSRVQSIYVGMGPCIRQKAYEVGADFEALFPGFYQPGPIAGKGYLDLAGFVRQGLLDAGILPERIEDCGLCTFQEQDHFYSYRRESQTRERILSVISMRGESYESK